MRLKTPVVQIGKVKIGGENSIAIQSMTNTDTADVKATVLQIIELFNAGSELVRITVNDEISAAAVAKIRTELNKKGYKNIALIGDFHFNGHRLLSEYPACAKALDKYRINSGNIGYGKNHDENFEAIIKTAIRYKKPVRIGGNLGSLDKELLQKMVEKNLKSKRPLPYNELLIITLVKSVLDSAIRAEELGLPQNKIILSVKISDVQDVIKAYELLAIEMQKSRHYYALHLGLTEAGGGLKGVISSASALAILLQEGIGDTIRISLTPAPKESRTKEVEACKDLLQSLGLRHFHPQVTSCPGCGRAANQLFQKIAQDTEKFLKKNAQKFAKNNPNFPNLKIAVMGCIVNGPGEASRADIAISLPGKNEKDKALVYKKGKLFKTISNQNINKEFLKILEELLPII
ncbi:MAG: flavodoxin-dependent (E)-4-hydroxy-3-methylbut-2-enyl-diphosphate synthase [Candidatus Gracilibacteria bacterium]|nr:flavodoxin-dependent (E)-4-hydroxy-3-methylbut-2-enyl-diphosphate synthase [Candidatus Gracilibacteria bacterium]